MQGRPYVAARIQGNHAGLPLPSHETVRFDPSVYFKALLILPAPLSKKGKGDL
jgi:hypothetical protein